MDAAQLIYRERLGKEGDFRVGMWKILCADFFQRYIPEDACVVDIGAGYCEFINGIRCAKKIAVDRNEDTRKHASADVEVVTADSADMKRIPDGCADAVFASHLFEHLTKEDIIKTLKETFRIIRRGGRLIIMQPNIRFCCRDYWMFFDHITPLDDRSMCEAIAATGFMIKECRPKFLPYTTKSKFKALLPLMKIYLKTPLLQRIFGQQMLIVAEKKEL